MATQLSLNMSVHRMSIFLITMSRCSCIDVDWTEFVFDSQIVVLFFCGNSTNLHLKLRLQSYSMRIL